MGSSGNWFGIFCIGTISIHNLTLTYLYIILMTTQSSVIFKRGTPQGFQGVLKEGNIVAILQWLLPCPVRVGHALDSSHTVSVPKRARTWRLAIGRPSSPSFLTRAISSELSEALVCWDIFTFSSRLKQLCQFFSSSGQVNLCLFVYELSQSAGQPVKTPHATLTWDQRTSKIRFKSNVN